MSFDTEDCDYLFNFTRGDDITFKVDIKDDQGNPVDITNWLFRSTMKRNINHPDDHANTIRFDSVELSGTDAVAGCVWITFDKTNTASMRPGSYVFDLQSETDGKVTTVLAGLVRVYSDVTQRNG